MKNKKSALILCSLVLAFGMIFSSISVSAAESTTNLAKGKTVLNHDAIGGEEPGAWAAENLVDGKRESEEGLNGYSTNVANEAQESDASFTIDFGEKTKLNRVVLYPRTDITISEENLNAVNFPMDFVIEVSDTEDFSDATELGSVTDKTTKTNEPVTVKLTEGTGQYVRLRATKLGDNEANSGFRLQLAEFEVYYDEDGTGTKTEEPTEKPTEKPTTEVPKTGDSGMAIPFVAGLAGLLILILAINSKRAKE